MKAARFLILVCVLPACGGEGTGAKLPVQVPPGASFSQITDTLSTRGIVKLAPIFRVYARLTGVDQRVKPGTYGFKRGQSWASIIADFKEGRFITAKLVIPEGWSSPGIAPRIAAISGGDSAKVLDLILDETAAARHGVPGPTLEGYLYPATYDFPLNIAADTMIARMIAAYKRIWNAARQARADSLQLTEREVITLASIVEKEAKLRSEMPTISSVYHNRLRIGYPLQADPTVQYARGTHRARLLYRDIKDVAEHPYNTYTHPGLPPGPIGSPSDAAIDATLYPSTTEHLYFVARADGTHIFTNSLDEHNRAKRQLKLERARTAADTAN